MKQECDPVICDFPLAPDVRPVAGGPFDDRVSNDSDLIAAFLRAGDQSAFAKLVERYGGMVTGVAFRRTRDRELAHDIAQEVFTTLARKLPSLQTRASIGGWLHQTAVYHTARATERERRRVAWHERAMAEAQVPDIAPMRADGIPERIAILDEVIETLSQPDREVLVLHFYQELSYVEMARLLGLKEPAVRQRVCRALDRLSVRLKERGVHGAVATLLAGAVAIQSSVAASGGLAVTALAAAAAAGGTSATSLAFAALSKGATALVIGCLGIATTWYVVNETPERELPPASSNAASVRGEISKDGFSGIAESPVLNHRASFAAVASASAPSEVDSVEPQRAKGPIQTRRNNAAALPRPARLATTNPSNATRQKRSSSPRETTDSLRRKATAESASGGSAADKDDLRLRLRDVAENGGLPAVVEELRRIEETPEEAAQVYGALLEEALAIEPGKRPEVEAVLEEHFENLKSVGVAGVKPVEAIDNVLEVVRENVVDETLGKLGPVLHDVAAPLDPIVKSILNLPADILEPVLTSPEPAAAPEATPVDVPKNSPEILEPEGLLDPVFGILDSLLGGELL